MRRSIIALLSLFALTMSVLIPIGAAGAGESEGLEFESQKTELDKSPTGSYIVVLKSDPLIVEFGQDGLTSPRAKAKGRAIERDHDATLEDAGASSSDRVQSYTNAVNGFSAILSYDEALALAADDKVAVVLVDELRQPDSKKDDDKDKDKDKDKGKDKDDDDDDDEYGDFLGLAGPKGPWQAGYDGEGVVVGIIDTGIWPEHPSFADDGSYPAPPVTRPPCEFGNVAHNAQDVPFACNNKLIGARQMLDTYRAVIGARPDEYDSARDDNGHGTHTASTAAGNAGVEASMYGEELPSVSGVAPRAHIIAYKGLGDLGGFTSDLAAAIDQAVADGVDVINYSVGGGPGTPGVDDIAFLFAANAGVFIATSAGNSGPGSSTLGNPATMPWMTTVGASTQTRFFEGEIELGDDTEYKGASITLGVDEATLVDAADAGGDLCIPGTLDPALVEGNIVLCRRGAIARADKSLAVLQAGGVGTILYNNSDVDNLFTDTHWTPAVHIDNTPGLAIKAYIASTDEPTAEIGDTQEVEKWKSAPSMAIFSSRGPNPVAPDLIKPDITAPGVQILAGNSPTPIGGVPGELFQAIAGTSMSSPQVAGIFALIKQANPDWSQAIAKSALMTTSYQDVVDNDRSSPAGPFDMGAGHADPSSVKKGSPFQPGLAYDAGLFEYAAFTCGMNWNVFTSGSCVFLESIGVPSDPSDLNYPSIGIAELAGSQTVTRTVTSVARESGWRTYDVSVDAPAGFDVTVEPSTLKLKTGQSATFEVTISNVSAPLGQWRHGSLTWTDRSGKYEVYSPISVNASLFDAPSQVSGTGVSGTASFNATFGYTGSYTAAAHGLAPADVTVDNVRQDPDQSFDPDDGYSNAHTFTLSGSALFRIAMPPEATEPNADLDIFVQDPTGAFVASSTSGGTDELIDLIEPMDGTWTVWVHGWSAPGGDSDYDLFTWDISSTPGGNLVIDGAPTSATIGSVATIDVSWTGATAGAWHLGAVSHTGDTGLIGLTLVEIDNR